MSDFSASASGRRACSIQRLALSLLIPAAAIIIAGCESKPKDVAGKKDSTAADTQVAGETKGATIYRTKCSFCHQLNGNGTKNLYPPLAGSERALGNPKDLVMIILNGMQGPITVKGVRYNNAMPGWRNFLSPEDIAEVLNHVRSSWGNKAPAITPAFVDSLQRATASQPDPIRSEIGDMK